MQNLSSQKLFLGLAALAGVGLIIVALTSFRPQSEPQVLTPPPAPPVAVAKVPKRIGIMNINRVLLPYAEGLKQGLADLGYVEGKDIEYAYQDSAGDLKQSAEHAKEFVNKNVDLIYAINITVDAALKETTATGKQIPIVFVGADSVVERGFVKSLKSSGNNVTGIANNVQELTAKKLEYLKRLNPNAKNIGIFGAGFMVTGPGTVVLEELRKQTPQVGLGIVEYKTADPSSRTVAKSEAEKIANSIKPGDIDAIFHIPGHTYLEQDLLEVATARRLKIPAISVNAQEVKDGGLYAYAPDYLEVGKQTAVIVNKVLKGTKPTDIPVEFPAKPILFVNLETARAIGAIFPEDLLAIAQKIVP